MRHLAVRRAGAHQRAEPRLLHQQVQQQRQQQAHAEDQQPVGRVVQPGQQLAPGRPAPAGADSGRSLPNTIFTPSFRIRISAKVASTCDRWSRMYSERSSADLQQPCRTAPVSTHRAEHAQHERAGQRHQPGGEERADHVQRAVRQVDHVHDAEDQRQPGRQQEQHQPELQPVEQLLEDEKTGHGCVSVAQFFILQSCT